jgi:hypothetical protein
MLEYFLRWLLLVPNNGGHPNIFDVQITSFNIDWKPEAVDSIN